MTTKDLQRVDELVHVADMAVRVASQLRLWLKRHNIHDRESLDEGIRFLDEAANGGDFIQTGEVTAASSSLYPLTWSADVRFGKSTQPSTMTPHYDELVKFLRNIRSTLAGTLANDSLPTSQIVEAAGFFDALGQFLGGKADSALRSPPGGAQLLQDRFSHQ